MTDPGPGCVQATPPDPPSEPPPPPPLPASAPEDPASEPEPPDPLPASAGAAVLLPPHRAATMETIHRATSFPGCERMMDPHSPGKCLGKVCMRGGSS